MGSSKSLFAYEDIRQALDKALEAKKGIKIIFETNGQAFGARHRFNQFRSMDRRENARIYPEDHKMHNRTQYDVLRLRLPKKGAPDDNVLFIEKRGADDFKIEEIIAEMDEEPVEAVAGPNFEETDMVKE